MDFYKILNKRCCSINLKAKTKEDCLRELSELAIRSELLKDVSAAKIYEQLAEREKQGSTGFGNEIAIPHARIDGMDNFLVYIAVSNRGIDFEALDKKKVKLFIVILGPPEETNQHLKILATVSRTIGHTNVKNELLKTKTETALYEAFLRNTDISSGELSKKRKMKLMMVNLYIDEFLYRILELFIEHGVEGATIMESSGMGSYISSVPLFAEFIGFMRENKNQSKTIVALVPEEYVDDIIQGIEEVTGDLDKKQGAMVMTMDIDFYKGSMAML